MYFVIRNQFGRAVVCPMVGAFWRWILDLETREVEEHMKYRHSFLQVLAAGLTVVFLVGAQYACRADAPSQTDAEEQMDAERAQGVTAGEIHWSYEGDTGPDQWGGLDSSFAVCDSGVQQSPIDLTAAIPAGGGGLEIQWQPTAGEIVDNGHTIQVNIDAGSSITLEGRQFSLLQFHFHLPSEHTVEGESYPMEVHFVHQAEEGDLAVIGVFMAVGSGHSAVQSIWDAIPGVDQASAPLAGLDPNAFLPGGRGYFRYAGSLTTPPCSEVVSWVVLTEPIAVSQAQVDAFAALYPMNARPVQPLYRRFILTR